MTRSIVRLEPEHLAAVDAPCGGPCLFWERDPVSRSRSVDPAADKAEWLADVQREWGDCGHAVLLGGVAVGYAVYAPAAFVPGAAAFPTAPVSSDAVLLTTVRVVPAASGGGLGKLLVQRMARDLVHRRVRAVEAFGDVRGRRECVLPVGFLEAVGFHVQREHGQTPRMRMDLRTALTWRSDFEAAWDRLVGAVRPSPETGRAPEASRVLRTARGRGVRSGAGLR